MEPVDDLTAVALTGVGEARGEGLKGMAAVMLTIRNRAALQSWRGLTPLECALKPWQYSCWNKGDANRAYLLNLPASDELYRQACEVAKTILDDSYKDFTNGATYYYCVNIPVPSWALNRTPCFVYGHHLFYKDIP